MTNDATPEAPTVPHRPNTDVDGCERSQAALDAWLAGLLAEGRLVPAAPSLLPGWTVGHVLTHLARNADANRGMLDAAELGLQRAMYPSARFRETDIAAGATRSAEVLVDDVQTAGRLLTDTMNQATERAWGGAGLFAAGRMELVTMPWRRWREIEVHRADLGLGYGPADWPTDYVAADLSRREQAWLSEGNSLPVEVASLGPALRLAWLFGRDAGPGLPPAPSM